MARRAQATWCASSRLHWWAVICLVAGAVAITWWVSSLAGDAGADHAVGPYDVPVAAEYAVGAPAVLSALVVAIAAPAVTRARSGLSTATAGLLIGAGVVATVAWRILTRGVVGANIGGGLVMMAAPVVVAGLIVSAVFVEWTTRRRSG